MIVKGIDNPCKLVPDVDTIGDADIFHSYGVAVVISPPQIILLQSLQ